MGEVIDEKMKELLSGVAKEDQPEWNWVSHGDGWALMQGRCSAQHGLNKLTVARDGFDWGGEEMRSLIAQLLNEHADKTHRALLGRIAAALHEPLELPEGCPPLGERIIGAIDMLYRERKSARDGEYEAIALVHAWAPVVRASLKVAQRGTEAFADVRVAVDALTDEQREAAEP